MSGKFNVAWIYIRAGITVGIVTRPHDGWTEVWIIVGADFSSPDMSRSAVETIHPLFQWVPGFFFGGKRAKSVMLTTQFYLQHMAEDWVELCF